MLSKFEPREMNIPKQVANESTNETQAETKFNIKLQAKLLREEQSKPQQNDSKMTNEKMKPTQNHKSISMNSINSIKIVIAL